jgi:anti-repressor protein
MSADLMPFTYEGATVRTVIVEGEPWFVLADLCRILDLANPSGVAARLDPQSLNTVRLAEGNRGNPNVTIVNESGMYEVVIRSDKPGAVAFRRWITAEVLPAIRKTGAYSVAAALPDRKALAQMVIDAEEAREAEHAARVEAERHARELAAPASAWSHMAESSGDYEVADAAKVLSRDPQISIGRDRLFRFMQAEGWIYRDPGTSRWKAYQTQVNTGRLVEKLGRPFLHEPSGEMRLPAPTIRITAKGLAELHKRLGGTDALPTLAAVGE